MLLRTWHQVGPFYGLALGDYADGTGGICVECSARVVAEVNTKNRLGKVDGRYPHWVAPYATFAPPYSTLEPHVLFYGVVSVAVCFFL